MMWDRIHQLMLTVTWKSGMAFEVDPPSGQKVVLDTFPDSDGEMLGPTPVEMLQASAAVCTAMDVVSILKKMRQTITSYRLEVESERGPEGIYPRPVSSMKIRHILTGPDLDPEQVTRAVQLSDEKYCSVIATLRSLPQITQEWKIE